ncbi:MAG: lysophospholipid acyltransferase family protein [Bacteriovoracaceae bacterium]
MNLIIALYRGFVCYLGMSINGLLVSSLYVLSAGKLRRFNAEVLSPFSCRLMLALIGVRLITPKASEFPKEKVIYMFNHNSYLDIFIVPLLGPKKTRAVISTKTKKILPLFLSNFGNGALFIPVKQDKENRLSFFNLLIKKLQFDDQSVLLSPEGVHAFKHRIAHFNKGVFHVATVSKTPICPLFFRIPKDQNPLESYFFKGGTISVEVLPIIETLDWELSDLEKNVQKVRQIFVQKFNQEFGESIQ